MIKEEILVRLKKSPCLRTDLVKDVGEELFVNPGKFQFEICQTLAQMQETGELTMLIFSECGQRHNINFLYFLPGLNMEIVGPYETQSPLG